MKIVFWSRLAFARQRVHDTFAAVPGIEFVSREHLDDCIAVLPGSSGMLLYNAPGPDARRMVAAIRTAAPQLRWMHFITAGREGFDNAGIPDTVHVTQTPGASAPAVAEHAMALLLALGRRVPDMLALAAQQRWDRSGFGSRCVSLEGQTLAVIGYGAIGREVARRARAFGMTVLAVSRSGAHDEHADEGHRLDALHAVLARSHAVVIALALVPQTRGLIDRAGLAALRRGALLVNVARGAIVDQAALVDALHSGQLGGAGLDVTSPEPPPPGDPLWSCPNTIISPHIAVDGSEPTARRAADGALHCFEQLRERLQQEPPTSA